MEQKTVSRGGTGFCGLLAIVFVVLKLCNVIAWSWMWVLSPIWIPLALVFVIWVISIILIAVASK